VDAKKQANCAGFLLVLRIADFCASLAGAQAAGARREVAGGSKIIRWRVGAGLSGGAGWQVGSRVEI